MKSLALIGAGKWGQNFIKTAQKLDEVLLSYIVSKNPKTQELAPSSKILSSFNELMEVRSELDGVIVATPPQVRSEIIVPLLNENICVLTEKPLCLDQTSLQEILNAHERSKAELLIDYTHLHNSALKKLIEIVHKNPPKKIMSFNSNYGPFRDFSGYWDYGPHEFALLIQLEGKRPENLEIKRLLSKKNDKGDFFEINSDIFEQTTFQSFFGNGDAIKQRSISAFYENNTICFNDLSHEKLVEYNVGLSKSDFKWDQYKNTLSGKSVDYAPKDRTPLENLLIEFCDVIDQKSRPSTNLTLGKAVVQTMLEFESL